MFDVDTFIEEALNELLVRLYHREIPKRYREPKRGRAKTVFDQTDMGSELSSVWTN